MTIPAIVINLDRSADRLRRMELELARVGMPFERFAAVDGNNLPAALPAHLKPYFCDESDRIASPLSPGEIGCYASHLGVWQRIVDSGLPAGLVCEDDIDLSDDLTTLLTATLKSLPAGWDIVRLVDMDRWADVRSLPLAPLPRGRHLIRYWRAPMRAGAYLVSNGGAHKLLKAGLRRHGVDADLRRPWLFGLDHYGVHPAPVVQHAHTSLIGMERGCPFARRQWRIERKARRALLMLHQHAYNLEKMGWQSWARLLVTGRVTRGPAPPRPSRA